MSITDYRIFALHDNDEKKKRLGAFEIDVNSIEDYNNQQFGIFWLLNDFDGDRKAKNCTKICTWFADIDEGTKQEQMKRIEKLTLKPSMIVETNKGYHVYWFAENATIENFQTIEQGIIQQLQADKHCIDPSRLLRCPYTYHHKNPKEPFLITAPVCNEKKYTEEQMLYVFKPKEVQRKQTKLEGDINDFVKPENWERIFKISQTYEGTRNATLAKYCMWMIDIGLPNHQVRYIIEGLNDKLAQPLPEWEIRQLLKGKGV